MYEATVTVICPGCGDELVVDIFSEFDRYYIEIEEDFGCPAGCDEVVTFSRTIREDAFDAFERLLERTAR